MPWSPSISVMRLIVEAVLTKAGSYERSPKSSGPVRNWRRSMARMAPLTMGRSEVLPVRLSMIVTELVAMVGTPSCRLISSGGRCSPLTPGKSVTGPDLLRGHRAALADSVPDEKPAVAIHAGDAAHESPASVMDLDLASRQDIAPAPRLEDGSRTVLPV